MNPTRREFLTGLTKVAGGAMLGYAALPLIQACTPTSVPLLPEQTTTPIGADGSISVDVSSLSASSPAFQVPSVLGQDGFGVMVTLPSAGVVDAFSMKCTHQSCQVDSQLAHFDIHCACHGSLFALDGSVMQGPAKQQLGPMQKDGTFGYPVTYDASTKVAKIQIIPK
ncbi:MAG TPA: Rieske 2Fe-2S domain-containing protein [Candidatus Kapabacteria bacterium]|nr:Rieske 2Fe-2S domain-containing protein [Candidatus Kapabacteria bacterium]